MKKQTILRIKRTTLANIYVIWFLPTASYGRKTWAFIERRALQLLLDSDNLLELSMYYAGAISAISIIKERERMHWRK